MMGRIETKVIAAAGGSGAGATIATFALWLLGVLVWHVPDSADKAGDAIAAVPSPVAGMILIVVSALGALAAGVIAPHTSRPDLAQSQPILASPPGEYIRPISPSTAAGPITSSDL